MSKTACYENLYIIIGNIEHTGLKASLRTTGKDKEFRNVES